MDPYQPGEKTKKKGVDSVKKVNLYAPVSYNAIERKKCNGCGSGWNAKLIPDNLLGCDITEACNIHDYMYETGKSIADKKKADRAFLNNMTRLVMAYSGNWFTLNLRLAMVKRYYNAVKYYGGDAFWAGKNKDTEIKEIYIKN